MDSDGQRQRGAIYSMENDDLFGLGDVNPMMDLFSQNVLTEDIITPDFLEGNNMIMVGNIPTKEEYPGPYNFMLTMDTNHQKWVYSQPLEQIFIGMNKVLVLSFNTELQLPHSQTFFIRAMPVYSNNEHINIPVNRCTFHACEDDPQSQAHQIQSECRCAEFNSVGHVVRAQCRDAIYCYDKHSTRHSVMIPVNRPQPGSDKIAIPYSFACKTSCPGGMQRRSIHLIFTLESATGEIVGRRILGVKICSCPKRDKDRQEKDYWNEKKAEAHKRPQQPNNTEVSPKRVKLENMAYLQLPPVGIESDHRREIKELKEMMNDFITAMNEKYNKILQKIDRIEQLQQNTLF